MMESELIAKVLKSADGEIVGRIRLQKIFYLLDQLGLNSKLKFAYHHYGPYSEELSTSITMAQLFDKSINEETGTTAFGSNYSIYKLNANYEIPDTQLGDIAQDKASQFITKMKSESSVVIELAATIHWLREKEQVAEWKNELKRRKSSKATDQNITKAEALLKEIGL